MDLSTNYSKLLEEIRLKEGWTQADIAKELGVKQAMISAIEKGTRQPGIELKSDINKLALSLGILGKDDNAKGQRPDAPPLGDREIGRLEGRIEELERQVQRYEAQIERHDGQISEVLNNVAEMLQRPKNGSSTRTVGHR